MATRTFSISKDALLSHNDSSGINSAGGQDAHLPAGTYSPGYHTYRSLLQFNLDFSSMVTITAATLYLRTTSHYHVTRGSSPSTNIARCASAWTANSAGESWTTNPTVYPGPGTTGTTYVRNTNNTNEQWQAIDLLDIVKAWAPTSVAGGGNAANNGILMWGYSSSSADVAEFYSKESSYDPYIVVTYTDNRVPVAPTNVKVDGAASGSVVNGADTNYTLSFSADDPDTGDTLDAWDYELYATTANGGALGALLASHYGRTSGITDAVAPGQAVSDVMVWGLTRGTWNAVRVRTKDGVGYGPWSATCYFKVNTLPTVSLTQPAADGRIALLTFQSGWASPRLNIAWSFADADGQAQAAYSVIVRSGSSGGTIVYQSNEVPGSVSSLVVPINLVPSTRYYISMAVKDATGEWSSWSTYRGAKACWSLATFKKDLTTAPAAWRVTPGPYEPAGTDVIVEYASTATDVTPSSWSLSVPAPLRFFHYRVWLLTSGTSPAPKPALQSLYLEWDAAGLSPDHWQGLTGNPVSIDSSDRVYGTQSLRIDGDGTATIVYQQIAVEQYTTYVLSGRIKANKTNPDAYIGLGSAGTSGLLRSSTPVDDHEPATSWRRHATATWYSGASVSVYVWCAVGAGTVAGDYARFDALKLEASKVITPWQPSYVGQAVVLDAGGLQIDTVAGGVFRLKSGSGARDLVEAGGKGLNFGGTTNPANLYSSADNQLKTDDNLDVAGGTLGIGSVPYDISTTGNGLGFLNTGAALILKAKGILLSTSYSDPDPAATGIQMGADVNLYRAAANELATDDMLSAPIVGAQYNSGAAITGVAAGATSANLAWGTKVYDTGSAYNATNKNYTVPTGKDGVYAIWARCNVVNQTNASSAGVRFNLNLNTSTNLAGDWVAPGEGGTNVSGSMLWIGYLAAGSVLNIVANPSGNPADCSLANVTLVRLHAGGFMA